MNHNSQNQGALFGFDTGSFDPVDVLSPPLTLGSIALVDGVSVFLFGQVDQRENGPWEFSGALGRLVRMTRRPNCRVGAFIPAGSVVAIGSGDHGGKAFSLFGSGRDNRGQPGARIGADTITYVSLVDVGAQTINDDDAMIQPVKDANGTLYIQRVRDNGTSSTVSYFDTWSDLHNENPSAVPPVEPLKPWEAEKLITDTRRRAFFDGQVWDDEAKEKLAYELSVCISMWHVQFEDCSFTDGWPDSVWGHPAMSHFYCYRCNFNGDLPVPPAGVTSNIGYLVFDQCPADSRPLTLPAEWANLPLLRYVYMRRNNYTSAEVNSLAQQWSDLLDAGMGSAHNYNHRLILNQTGASANQGLTVVPAGWEQVGGYIRRSGKNNQRIYHN